MLSRLDRLHDNVSDHFGEDPVDAFFALSSTRTRRAAMLTGSSFCSEPLCTWT